MRKYYPKNRTDTGIPSVKFKTNEIIELAADVTETICSGSGYKVEDVPFGYVFHFVTRSNPSSVW